MNSDQQKDRKERRDTTGISSCRDPAVPRIDSEALFNDGQVVIIVHEDQDYVLRITRNGKLILNK